MNVKPRTAWPALLLATLTGCATIIDGRRQNVSFHSDPPARVFVDGRDVGRTPTSSSIVRRSSTHATFQADGFQDRTVEVDGRVNGVTLLNIPLFLFGIIPGVVGFAVDLGTGAFWEYDPDDVSVHLTPLEHPPTYWEPRRP